MKKEEFNLSEKRKELKTKIINDFFSEVYKLDKNVQKVSNEIFDKIEEQDKEFIKRLKEEICRLDIEEGLLCSAEGEIMRRVIDKLAGEKLK